MEVTVIVTTYNHERYIAQALDSVLMQETDFDYEIVILEDCSSDSTREIVLAYQKRHPDKIRLRLAAQNECSNKPFAEEFQAARSRYIATLDGDDYWTSPKKLQKQVEFLETHPDCALCFHNALIIYEDESRAQLPYNPTDQKRISVLEDIWQSNFIASCTPMFRNDVLGDFPEWFHSLHYGDWSLYLLCAQHGKIGYIDEILGVYRIHSQGFWSKLTAIQKLEGLIAFYETMNINLDLRFNDIVEPLLSARRKELAVARALVETAQKILPSGTVVLVMARAGEDLPPLKGHQVWAFPDRSGKQTQQQFASGAAGSSEASWIGAGAVYEFRLYRGTAQDTLLASVTVTQNGTVLDSTRLDPEPYENGTFIDASPNPVPAGTKQGKTTISWSTADGSPGVIQVLMKSLQMQYPANDDEAIEQFELLRAKGGEFLLVPRKLLAWLQGFPGLKEHLDSHYPLVQDDESCRIYDIRERETKSQPASHETVRAALWGHEMVMGSDHHLLWTLAHHPRYSEPIALLVQVMPHERLRFIDVGTNIGDTVCLVESCSPGKCTYLCVEPDESFLRFCKQNTANIKSVTLLQGLVDEGQSKPFTLSHHTPGTAFPRQELSDNALYSATLDSLAADFVSANGGVDIIKIDTDGFDARVLRSAKGLLEAHKPMLFFELAPYFWAQANEDPQDAFRYLNDLGYQDYVFFANRGTVYAQISKPSASFLATLIGISESRRLIDGFHYDVLTGDPDICQTVTKLSLKRTTETGLL
jgi:FkbM family methyltransferase